MKYVSNDIWPVPNILEMILYLKEYCVLFQRTLFNISKAQVQNRLVGIIQTIVSHHTAIPM